MYINNIIIYMDNIINMQMGRKIDRKLRKKGYF